MSVIAGLRDRIKFLIESKVGDEFMLGYEVDTLKRPREEVEEKSGKKPKLDSLVADELKCLICMEILY